MYRKKIYKVTLLLMLTLFGMVKQVAFAAVITATVERNPVRMDESFKIYFTADESPGGDPDFSPLEHDFTIINQSQSSNSSWVNGNYSKSIQWVVEATANRPGKLVIPAITFGNDTSEPLGVMVLQANENNVAANASEEMFLEVKASPEQPYVQSQVIYTIDLYRRVELAQAELSEPELPDAVIEKLGEDSNFNTVVNGVSYAVTERKYAIFPQKSGKMAIKPLTLSAAVVTDRPLDFRDFFSRHMTKTKRILSEEITLDVKPAPAEFKGKDWLAAEKLELTQEWSGDIQQMKVGEPLTRTLTLRGEGVTVGQLPELSSHINDNTDIKSYPDQPVLDEQKQTGGMAALRQEKMALIPAKPGQHTLPAVEIPWFNTKTQKMEIARLPETTVHVVGSAATQPKASAAVENLGAPAAQRPKTETVIKKTQTPVTDGDLWQNHWFWATVLLAFVWLSTVLIFWYVQHKKPQIAVEKINHLNQEASLKQAINNLKTACAKDDAQAARKALLDWGKQRYSVDNLSAIAAHCNPRLNEEILLLNQALYSKNNGVWYGKQLSQAFNDHEVKARIPVQGEAVLEPLHRL